MKEQLCNNSATKIRNRQIKAANTLLNNCGLNTLDAARLCLELMEALHGDCSIARLRHAIRLGAEALHLEEQSVSFSEAVEFTLRQKSHLSPRSLDDIRQTSNKLMRCEAMLAQRAVRGISTAEWTRILDKTYGHAPSRYVKARANLSGIYTLAFKQGWCQDNPIKRIDVTNVQERTIEPLRLNEIQTLLRTARLAEHRDCLPALGLMLYAGVRPDEVSRITWHDIDWEEGELHMHARHTKTGGGRHIPLCQPLLMLLKKERTEGAICPDKWKRRWQQLRHAAGFKKWVPDILRHSYASYHAKMYKDLPQLQLAMGHRDCRLLLTRYINLRGISKKDAQSFWRASWLKSS